MTERFHLDSDFTGKGFLLFIKYFPSRRPFFISGVINARPILRARVKPLFVERSRINDVVKQLQQCFQRKLLTLPGDIGPLFRPQGAGADILTKYIL